MYKSIFLEENKLKKVNKLLLDYNQKYITSNCKDEMSGDIFRNMLLNISENEFTYIVLSHKEGASNQDMFYFTSVNKVVIPLSNMVFENNYKTWIENNDISKLSSTFHMLPRLKNQNIEKQELGVLKKNFILN